ncbi:MAG: tetratricopeptide repeat protein [Candidatus Methylomirabilales bacterium]
MNGKARLTVTLAVVFFLGQGCSLLTASSSAASSTAERAMAGVRETHAVAPRSPIEDGAAYYEFLLGGLAENRGDLRAALRHYKAALALDPDSLAIRLALAGLYMQHGVFRQAIDVAEEILSVDPENVEAHLLLATAYENIRNGRMAERYYRETLRLQPNRADVYLRLGNLYTRARKYAEAVEAYRKAMARDPDLYQARYNLARVLLETDQAEEAIAHLQQVLELRPGFDQASLLLGLTYEQQGEWERAREVYRKSLQEDPTNRSFRERLAGTYLRSGDPAGALAELQRIADDHPEDLALRNRIGLLLIELRRYAEAQQLLEEVLAQDQDNREAQFYLAISLEGQEQYEEAFAALTKIPSGGERYSDVLIHKGFVLGHLDRLDEALAAFEGAARLKPEDGNARYLVGVTQLRRKEYGQAAKTLEEAVHLNPNNANYHYQLGAAYERNRELEKAEHAFRQTLKMNPKHADAYNYLGYMFADEGIHLAESVVLIKKALELDPNNGAFVDSLGWAYYKLGRLDEALRELKRAVTLLKKEDPTILEHLGDVLFQKGMISRAVEQWERSLALDATNGKLKEKLQRARSLLLHGKP